jgi:hypothetical protein
LKIQFLKKPKVIWAFLFLTFQSHAFSNAFADNSFVDRQIKPVATRAFDSESRTLLVAGFGSTLLANTQDNSMRDQWTNNRQMPENISKYGDEFGTSLVGPLIAAGQLIWDPENSYSHIRALIYTTGVTHILKESIRRDRPNSQNHQSMPSGHSSSAFATATSLTYAYGWKAGALMYPVATFVAFSRLADDAHWFSDTVAGAFIGVWMGRATFYSLENPSHSSAWIVTPVIAHDRVGVSFDLEF